MLSGSLSNNGKATKWCFPVLTPGVDLKVLRIRPWGSLFGLGQFSCNFGNVVKTLDMGCKKLRNWSSELRYKYWLENYPTAVEFFYSDVEIFYSTIEIFYLIVEFFSSIVEIFYSIVEFFSFIVEIFYSAIEIFYSIIEIFYSIVVIFYNSTEVPNPRIPPLEFLDPITECRISNLTFPL